MLTKFKAFLSSPMGLSTLCGCTLGLVCALALATFADLPQINELQNFQPKGITKLLDVNGELVYEFYRERRIPIAMEDIPAITEQAFLVAEDWDFYDHFGIDIIGIARAMVRNILELRFAQGASTITQQLSRGLFLSAEKTIARKLKEMFLTIRIERNFSKKEILHMYLNQIYLGEGTYGIEAASEKYFGKSVQDLSIAENALLASLPKGPSLFSPFANPERSAKRRDLILSWMLKRNVINQTQYHQALEEPLPLESNLAQSKQSYFSFHVIQGLKTILDQEQIYKGYLEIHSTMDLGLQNAMETAIEKGLEDYALRHKLDPKNPKELPQMAAIAMDPHTGDVRAMVGGSSFSQTQFNRALMAKRQPGSSIKPLLYATAIESGWTQSHLVEDTPISFDHPVFGSWTPQNYDKSFDGWMTLRTALEKSKNTAAIKVLQDIGIGSFIRMLHRMGIESDIPTNLTIALGSPGIRLIEMARAYAIFANLGLLVEPNFISRVEDEFHQNLWTSEKKAPERVLEDSTAFIMTDMLRSVIERGSGKFASDLPCPIAGKTGTTNDYKDSLFVGYTPSLVVAVWTGYDQQKDLGFGETGSRTSGRVWKDIMAHQCMQESGTFTQPNSVEMIDIDHDSGLLPGKYCVDILQGAFKIGTGPTQTCHPLE
ncbi:MAG: PBP1A family penicillin-binding protein [Bdellovibrionota bacterium]